MSKRRLSNQQRQRLRQRSSVAGKSSPPDINDAMLGPVSTGLVIAHQGNHVEVEGANGQTIACHVRAKITTTVGVVTGDHVEWQAVETQDTQDKGTTDRSHAHSSEQKQGVVTGIRDRTNLLARVDNFGKNKLIAANVDRMIITTACTPLPQLILIDRYLILAHHLGLEATLLYNKTDLGTEAYQELKEIYPPLGVELLTTSSTTKEGLNALKSLLAQGTNIFVGQSGVGKSSLLQLLLPGEVLKVGEIAESIGQGKHTTTQSRLYHLPSGGRCIDSPGIRDLGLWHLDNEAIKSGFRDVLDKADECQFRDCQHQHEPRCAVKDALASGALAPSRFANYCQILDSQHDSIYTNQTPKK